MLVVQVVQCFVCHSISVFTFDLLHLRHVCISKHRVRFQRKICQFGNLSLLINFQKLSAVFNTVSIVHFSRRYLICRYGHLICLERQGRV